jgi:hypothetical protein
MPIELLPRFILLVANIDVSRHMFSV